MPKYCCPFPLDIGVVLDKFLYPQVLTRNAILNSVPVTLLFSKLSFGNGRKSSYCHWSLGASFALFFLLLFVFCFCLFVFLDLFFSFIFISWRLITLQYCTGFYHTLTWISQGFTCVTPSITFFFPFIFISWRLIILQYCSGFCHTWTWISHGFTCVPHPDAPSCLLPHLIPLGLPSAPALSTCVMHPAWAGDLFHPW